MIKSFKEWLNESQASKVSGKNYKDLVKNLEKNGYKLDKPDANDLEHDTKRMNGAHVNLYGPIYGRNQNSYVGMVITNTDGSIEICNIKQEKHWKK